MEGDERHGFSRDENEENFSNLYHSTGWLSRRHSDKHNPEP